MNNEEIMYLRRLGVTLLCLVLLNLLFLMFNKTYTQEQKYETVFEEYVEEYVMVTPASLDTILANLPGEIDETTYEFIDNSVEESVIYYEESPIVENTKEQEEIPVYNSSDWERTLLAYMVWGEISITDNTSDYYGAYLQACVALNRVNSGSFPNSITDVIYQSGQFVTSWYEQLMNSGNAPNSACWAAVDEALYSNTTPSSLLYADCRGSIPNGCYLYYESPTGQRFYCMY